MNFLVIMIHAATVYWGTTVCKLLERQWRTKADVVPDLMELSLEDKRDINQILYKEI